MKDDNGARVTIKGGAMSLRSLDVSGFASGARPDFEALSPLAFEPGRDPATEGVAERA